MIVPLIGLGLILHGLIKAPSPEDTGFVIAGVTIIVFGINRRRVRTSDN